MAEPWPLEVNLLAQGKTLSIAYDTEEVFTLPAEYLRVESPSAEVRGHSPDQEQLVTGKRDVSITKLEPVGSYALRIHFSDSHSTGLYTWAYLYELGHNQENIWQAYLKKLETAGAQR